MPQSVAQHGLTLCILPVDGRIQMRLLFVDAACRGLVSQRVWWQLHFRKAKHVLCLFEQRQTRGYWPVSRVSSSPCPYPRILTGCPPLVKRFFPPFLGTVWHSNSLRKWRRRDLKRIHESILSPRVLLMTPWWRPQPQHLLLLHQCLRTWKVKKMSISVTSANPLSQSPHGLTETLPLCLTDWAQRWTLCWPHQKLCLVIGTDGKNALQTGWQWWNETDSIFLRIRSSGGHLASMRATCSTYLSHSLLGSGAWLRWPLASTQRAAVEPETGSIQYLSWRTGLRLNIGYLTVLVTTGSNPG